MPKVVKASGATKATGPSVAALERSPSHLLHRALQLALDVYVAEAGPDALTQRQFAVLAAVEAHEEPTQTDLVRATGIDRSTLADMIARMTARGVLVRQRSDHDARANVVRLTEAGRLALVEAQPRAAAADLRILSALGAAKRDAFVAALRALARAGESTLLGDEPMIESEAKAAKTKTKIKTKRDDKPGKKARRKAKKARRQAQGPADAVEPPA